MAFSKEGYYLENGEMKDSGFHEPILDLSEAEKKEEALEACRNAIESGIPVEDARLLYLGED